MCPDPVPTGVPAPASTSSEGVGALTQSEIGVTKAGKHEVLAVASFANQVGILGFSFIPGSRARLS